LFYVTISDPEGLAPFAEFGITLLLFTIGLELSFNRLWTMRRLVFGLGAMELAIIGASLAGIMFLIGQSWGGSVALGLALELSCTALVVPIAGTQEAGGRSSLAMLLFEYSAIVPIIFMLGALAPYAQQDGWEGLFDRLWMGALVVAVMMIGGRYLLPKLFAQAARTKSPELVLAASPAGVDRGSLA